MNNTASLLTQIPFVAGPQTEVAALVEKIGINATAVKVQGGGVLYMVGCECAENALNIEFRLG